MTTKGFTWVYRAAYEQEGDEAAVPQKFEVQSNTAEFPPNVSGAIRSRQINTKKPVSAAAAGWIDAQIARHGESPL